MFRIQEILKKTCNESTEIKKLSHNDLSRLQSHLIIMYKDLEKLCNKYNIQICLGYGNVLGAIRHNGWIPWDDDLDIIISRADYNLLLKHIHELPPQYVLYSNESKDGPITRFPKLIDISTKFESILDLGPDHHEGVFIDIFIFDYVPSKYIMHKIKRFCALGIMFIANSINQRDNVTEIYKKLLLSSKKGKISYQIRQIIGFMFSFISLNRWFKILDKLIQYKTETDYIYCGEDSGIGWTPILKSIIFPPAKIYLSNGTSVYIPNKSIEFLNLTYNNWEIIPKEEEKWQHYVKDFSLPDIKSN